MTRQPTIHLGNPHPRPRRIASIDVYVPGVGIRYFNIDELDGLILNAFAARNELIDRENDTQNLKEPQ